MGILAILVVLLPGSTGFRPFSIPVSGLLALAWTTLSRTPWRDVGYSKPRNWTLTVVIGVLFGVLLKLVLKAVVLPLLGAGPTNEAYSFLRGNTAILPAAIWAMLVAGFGEETVFRGFLFERLGKIFGSGPWAKALIVVITTTIFAAAHYRSQGIVGVEQAAITGFVLGTTYALVGQVWIPMIAHAVFDLTALVIIYLNLEATVAHLIFK